MRSLIAVALLGLVAFAAAKKYDQHQEYEKPEEYDSNDRVGKLADKYEDTYEGDTAGHSRYGYDKYGYDTYGYSKGGHDKNGYHREGYHKDGHDPKSYDKHAYDKNGYRHDGYDKYGNVKNGYNKDCYHKDGYYNHGSCSNPVPAPLATLLGNPPGKWNNNGELQVSSDCIPLFNTTSSAIGTPALDNPGLLYLMLATGSLPATPLFETTVLLNLFAINQMTLWTAIAQYTPTMQPFWPIPGVTNKQPDGEQTMINKNTAMLYASYTFWSYVLPAPLVKGAWMPLFAALGLNQDNTTTDPTTAVGIGNLVGAAGFEQLASTNWNAQGNLGYTVYQRPYADQIGFVPINTAYELKHPLMWQPLLETTGLGYFQVQSHITPQGACAEAILADKTYIRKAKSPAPYKGFDYTEYKANADFVLELSAGLTDEQKMTAEYFDDKGVSFGLLGVAIALAEEWTPDQYLVSGLHDVCFMDAAAMVWREKLRHQAVRPISAIRHIYEDSNVTAWLQSKGTQTFPGREWTSYLRTMPHADYPSFTACVCAVYGSYYKEMTGTNTFPNIGPITFQAGCSRREPGITPAEDVSITYTTWDQFVDSCAQTRAYAGVHFQAAIDEAKRLCAPVGKQCYKAAYKQRYGPNSTPAPV